ncbi:MAG TPA: O-antigen ligase domain-containing protein [Pseudolabrys sp.]|nr:O-antigen ligase domain-containing protein [Pseudolabrys sp.]
MRSPVLAASDIALPSPPIAHPVAAPFTERLLLVVLFITMALSSIAVIEPSPHDAMMGVLLITSFIAGVRFYRLLAVPLLLLLVWNVSGMIALTNALGHEKTVQYTGTSLYLAVAGLLFACLFADHTMPRLSAMRIGYLISAICAALAGIAGYFHLFPGADMFAPDGRALGPFKDPNVFGPYLIWPALFLVFRMLTERVRVLDLGVLAILLMGLLLAFSRGAWFHFTLSALVTITIGFLTAPNHAARLRIFVLTAVAIATLAALLVFLLSFSAIGNMFTERAHLIQYYDVGQGGRFRLQELALTDLLNWPGGMGPFEFARIHGVQQHNVYLQAFLVYGWTGAMGYILLLLTTIYVGLRTSLIRTPWQPYVITAFGAFVGEVAEGFVIDTDHWRHFYLLLGIIWGLAVATLRARARRQSAPQNIRWAQTGLN